MDVEVIEIVAKSYHAEVGRRSGVNLTWEASYPDEQDSFRRVVAAALVALRAEGYDVVRLGDCAEIDVEDGWVRGDDETPMTNGIYRLVPAERRDKT